MDIEQQFRGRGLGVQYDRIQYDYRVDVAKVQAWYDNFILEARSEYDAEYAVFSYISRIGGAERVKWEALASLMFLKEDYEPD